MRNKAKRWLRLFVPVVLGIGSSWGTLSAQSVGIGFQPEVRLVEVGKGYSRTSVNTTIFRNNSVVTHGDEQYIGYYDGDGFLTLGKRTAGSEQWTLHRTQYKGNVEDAHNVVSVMLDGDGYLHVAFDHHGHPLNYCRSLAPYSLKLGEKKPMTGIDEHNVTYPEFYLLPGGNLLFAYRSGSSGRGNLVLNGYDVKNRKWHRIQDVLIDGEEQRSAYWQMYVDERGTIHLSWVWRETWHVETNHDLCYARSFDNGVTWYKSDGEKYELPIRVANAEYACRIPQESELINQTGMSADAEGNPYIASYWRDADSDVPQYRVVWHDGQKWNIRQVSSRRTPFSLKGGGTKMIPVSRPRIVVDKGEVFYLFRDVERGSRVSVAHTEDVATGRWNICDLTGFSVDAWEPSHDTELWKQKRLLHLFVQKTMQGDGEQAVEIAAQPIYVLEVLK
ncbi:BNR repeat-containing protein [Bacteroides heparinolyticus]|uniref:BNR repeat-containing protein n=1 Tax=Prevotella heparinolytica TaxID=28113 RepID=UPI0035A0E9A0